MTWKTEDTEKLEAVYKTDVKPVLRRFREWVAGKPTAFWIIVVLAVVVAVSLVRWLA